METVALILGGLALLVYARVEYIRRYIARRQAKPKTEHDLTFEQLEALALKDRVKHLMRPYPVTLDLPFLETKPCRREPDAN